MSIVQRALRDILFLRNAPNPHRAAPTPILGTTVYLLLKRHPDLSVTKFKSGLHTHLSHRLRAHGADLGYPTVNQYHNLTAHGLEVIPYTLGRSYPALWMISNLWNLCPPPKFRASITPHYDAMIELQYDAPIDSGCESALLKFADSLKGICAEVSTCECDRTYALIDDPSTDGDSVFLTVITRTPWNRTRAEAQRYWIGEHAPLLLDNADHTNLSGYKQAHTTLRDDSPFDNEYSGVATIEFARVQDYFLHTLSTNALRFNNTLILDEMNLTMNSGVNFFRRHDPP